MLKPHVMLPLLTILFAGLFNTQAQNLSIVDCSAVLILPQQDIESGITEIDSTLDTTMDSVWINQNDFDVMFILELSDTLDLDKVHINLGHTVGDSNLLNSNYSTLSNTADDLIFNHYNKYVNIKIGEFTVDSILFYEMRLENNSGQILSTYSDTLRK